jgi:hypothetical protein
VWFEPPLNLEPHTTRSRRRSRTRFHVPFVDVIDSDIRKVVSRAAGSCLAGPGGGHECELWNRDTNSVVEIDSREAVEPDAWLRAANHLAALAAGKRVESDTHSPCRGRVRIGSDIEAEPYGAWHVESTCSLGDALAPVVDGLRVCTEDVVVVADVMSYGTIMMCIVYQSRASCACDALRAAHFGIVDKPSTRRLVVRYRPSARSGSGR